MKRFCLFFVLITLFNCSSDDTDSTLEPTTISESIYFPPINSSDWETLSIQDLDWDSNALNSLLDFIEENNTKGFIILYKGKIVIEAYFNDHSHSSFWYWASAGKTLTTALSGIAQNENLLDLNDKVSKYLGMGWTNAPHHKEDLITCKHLLSMTSGLDDSLGDVVSSENLRYLANAGDRWAYHNVYVKMQDVIASATQENFVSYFNDKLKTKIGMNGFWRTSENFNVYWSTTRSMARFGLLIANNGKWQNTQIISEQFMKEATNTSQPLNEAYGYLWWLNGKSSYKLPQTQLKFQGSLIPNAPDDTFCALGKNDQKIYIVPSKDIVVVRMGQSAQEVNFALTSFDDELWKKINALIK